MTVSERPLVSIVIPSFNQGRYIRETIDSTLAQDYRPIEVLVFDGGSKDDTLDVLKSYHGIPELQWWSEPDRGVVDAVNKGLARVRGEIVAIQSSDDIYVPGAFRAVLDEFRHSSAALVYGDVEYIDAQSQVGGRTNLPPFDLRQFIGKRTFIPQPAAFFTAEAMRRAGKWRDDISYAADSEFYLRIATQSPVRKIDRVLARYRYHDDQRDKAAARVPRDWAKAIEPWTKSPDRATRRAARSGIDFVRIRYTPERRWARRTMLVWHALLVNPPLIVDEEFRAANPDLLPGRYPIFRTLVWLKRYAGAFVYDWPRFVRAMLGGRRGWLRMRNRAERTSSDPATGGVRCEWIFTSDLHIASVFPRAARWLMRRAFAAWPIALAERFQGGEPRVSFIIGHRGAERTPLLLKTLGSIAGQRGVAIECIVVEQEEIALLAAQVPQWVRYLHTPVAADAAYNRSAAFNAGARMARAPLLVFHDNDMLVPAAYALELAARHAEGWEFIDLKRFIFYLLADETARILATDRLPRSLVTDRVMQNARGGSIAADRDAFVAIGGFDESFVGWGGEDNDFWDRAETHRTWTYGYLPFIHLFHAQQSEKQTVGPAAWRAHLDELQKLPPAERIALLQKRSK